MRMFINCSEPVRYESHQMFLERFAANGVTNEMLAVSYAMAENTFAVTQTPLGQAARSGCGGSHRVGAESLRPAGRARSSQRADARLVRPGDRQHGGEDHRRCGEHVARSTRGTGRRAERLHVERVLQTPRFAAVSRRLVSHGRYGLHRRRGSVHRRALEGPHHQRGQEHLSAGHRSDRQHGAGRVSGPGGGLWRAG